jgi:hypothetical protein
MMSRHPVVALGGRLLSARAFGGKYKREEMTRCDGMESIDSIPWFDFSAMIPMMGFWRPNYRI